MAPPAGVATVNLFHLRKGLHYRVINQVKFRPYTFEDLSEQWSPFSRNLDELIITVIDVQSMNEENAAFSFVGMVSCCGLFPPVTCQRGFSLIWDFHRCTLLSLWLIPYR